MQFDNKKLRASMGRFVTGVTAISWESGGVPMAMTVNAFMSVSLAPPLLAVSIKDLSKFHRQTSEDGCFAVNILSSKQDDISRHFGGFPQERLGIPFSFKGGVPIVEGAIVSFICETESIIKAGDHHIYIGSIRNISELKDVAPLVFYCGKYCDIQDSAISI